MEERGWAYRRRQPEGTVLYEAVRDHLATLLAEASEVGRGLPRYVERDFARYLECGVLAHGFTRVRCESCKDELLVVFSCKGRGVCPSCNAKRAHVTAVHLVERVEVFYNRQRRHSTLGYLSPAEYEQTTLPDKLAA